MKSNALKLSIGISIYLLLAGNTWSATIYQCVNEAKEISFSNQPCGESETLVKEHEIDENTNVIGSGATTQTPGAGTSTGTSPTAGTGSTTPAGGEATPAPAAGGGSRAGGGGGGSSAGGSGAGGPAASSDGTGAAQTTGTNTAASTSTPDPSITDIQQPSATETQASEPAAISTETATATTSSESQVTTTSTKAQATSVSTPLASAGVTVISSLTQDPSTSYIVNNIIVDQIKKEITVNGSAFGTGPNIILYDTFENGEAGQPLPLKNPKNTLCQTKPYLPDIKDQPGPLIGCWDNYATTDGKPVYFPMGHSGNFSFKIFYPELDRALPLKKVFNGATEIFISYWVKLPEGTFFPGKISSPTEPGVFAEESAWKFTWLTDGAIDSEVSNVCLPNYSGSGSFLLAGNDSSISGVGGNSWWSWKNWMKLGIWLRANSVDPLAPGNIIFQATSLDKGFYQDYKEKPIFDADGPYPKQYSDIIFPGWVRSSSHDSTNPLYDDIYIATGPNAISRVELSNSPTYGGSTNLAIQIPIDWSENKIKVSIIDTGFDNITAAYLYITDSYGNVNNNGYPLNPN